ncbi:MAG: nucleotide exchange factor GrpE [Acidimicrobiales bacterium]|nr:nucleotide exchange factor GrpE [Acidimicrobiales bacterium]
MTDPHDDLGGPGDISAGVGEPILDGGLLDVGAVDAPVGDGPTEPVTVEALVADLERVASERDHYLDTARRSQADFENFRKQAQRRQEDMVERSLAGLVERLLPVLDACDGALAHGAADVEPIVSALLGVLEKEGLSRIDPIGEPFDPTVADAVVHEPGDGGEHIVSEVLRAGYAWQGRVVRPAMVKVTD